jgi:hypothetical protein
MRITDHTPHSFVKRDDYISDADSSLELTDIDPGDLYVARFILNPRTPAIFAGNYFVIVEGITPSKPERTLLSLFTPARKGYEIQLLPSEDEQEDPKEVPPDSWPIDQSGYLNTFKPYGFSSLPVEAGYLIDTWTFEELISGEELTGNRDPYEPCTPVAM